MKNRERKYFNAVLAARRYRNLANRRKWANELQLVVEDYPLKERARQYSNKENWEKTDVRIAEKKRQMIRQVLNAWRW